MLDNDFPGQVCSIARSLEVVGERWTILILRDVFLGASRFDELVADLGITRSILTRRLATLVEHGVLERHEYQRRPVRSEYRLTAKGRDLLPVLVTLMHWGDRYYAPDGPPRLLLHRECGGALVEALVCARCGTSVTPERVDAPAQLATASGRASPR